MGERGSPWHIPRPWSITCVEEAKSPLRAPLDTVVEKARGFESSRGILHCTCHPCPPGYGIPLGENYRPPFGNHRDTNPGQTKNIQKNKKMKI